MTPKQKYNLLTRTIRDLNTVDGIVTRDSLNYKISLVVKELQKWKDMIENKVT